MPGRTEAMKELIARNAEEVRRLHDCIHETYRLRDKSLEQKERWQQACAEFHARYDKLAFPGGYNTAIDRILAGDSEAIEAALCFIEMRPYFFRSGYMFKALLPKLKRAPLSAPEAARLQTVLSAYDAWREAKRQGQGITTRSRGDARKRARP
ncbi:MAG TPA: hypothetical protein VJM12_00125 [Pyrinomonadaceae bacterium]|nr:hypothetical protein [Pyrinomonadaceae bacterium]